jgi:hypothetical protein
MARGTRTVFYADIEDFRFLDHHFQIIGELNYAKSLWREGEKEYLFKNLSNIPNLGIVTDEDNHICDRCIFINDKCDIPIPEKYQHSDGRIDCTLDTFTNPSAIMLCLGGEYRDNTLIASEINTLGLSERSKELKKLFSKPIVKAGTKGSYGYALPGALNKYKSGWRLTTGYGYHSSQDFFLA